MQSRREEAIAMQRKVLGGFSSVFVLLAAALSLVVAAYGGDPTPTPNRTAARLLTSTATLTPTPELGAPKPVAEPIRLAAQPKEASFQKKWQELITAAQREGRVNVMMGGGSTAAVQAGTASVWQEVRCSSQRAGRQHDRPREPYLGGARGRSIHAGHCPRRGCTRETVHPRRSP